MEQTEFRDAHSSDAPRPSPGGLMAYLRLCRLPTVFTALADICAGFLLVHATLEPLTEFLWLLGASAGLYLSGMVFNDVFDRHQDARERPTRPIPSGAVPLRSAILFGSGLMGAGVACAFLASFNSFLIGLLLCVSILAYDGGMKRTPVGPVLMGACRFFNLLLGASSAGMQFTDAWRMPQLWVALSMGIYITGVTWFARREATENRRGPLVGALIILDLGLVGLALWISEWTSRLGWPVPAGALRNTTSVLFLWLVIALTINRRALAAIILPVPERIQLAITTMLLSVVVMDAMVIYYQLGDAGVPYAIGTVCLLIPSIVLRRWIPLT